MIRRDCGRRSPAIRARIVGLPRARQSDISQIALSRDDRDRATPVGDVVPHETAGLTEISRCGDYEGCFVTDLAIGILSELDIGNDGVVRIVRIEFAERAPANLGVR